MLTTNELQVLKAIDASEYGEYITDSVWTFTIRDHSNLTGKTISGTVSSLVKKGYVQTAGEGKDQEIGITDAGVVAYKEALQGQKPRKTV